MNEMDNKRIGGFLLEKRADWIMRSGDQGMVT